MASFDVAAFGVAVGSTVLWTIIGAFLAVIALWIIDRATPDWFHLRSIGENPTATAIFASGIVVGLAVLIAGVILSP